MDRRCSTQGRVSGGSAWYGSDMRVVITAATGNIGTSANESMGGEDRIGKIVGVARRRHPATDALAELLDAMGAGARGPTPALS